MRNLLLYGFVGLISVGCAATRDGRETKCDDCCENKSTVCRVTRPANGGHVKVDASAWSKSVGEPVPLDSAPAVLGQPKGQLPASECKVGDSAVRAKEMALAKRDATSRPNKSLPEMIVEAPSTPAKRFIEPAVVSAKPINDPKDEIPARRTNGTPAEKYNSLTGQVQEFRKTLRLRYAPIDQVDIYGGSVILEDGPILNAVRNGQRIRVEGELIPPTDRNNSAHYRVQSVEILD